MSIAPKVLLIDDSMPIQRVVRAALKDLNLELQCVASIETAQAYLDKTHPDLILLDLNIPEKGALPLISALRADRMKFPIVLLMTPLDDFDMARARRCGATGVFIKPFAPLALQELVARHCPNAWGDVPLSSRGAPQGDPSALALERIRREVLEVAPNLTQDQEKLSLSSVREALLEHLEKVMAPRGMDPLIEDIFREVIREELVRILPAIVRQEVRLRIRSIERDAEGKS